MSGKRSILVWAMSMLVMLPAFAGVGEAGPEASRASAVAELAAELAVPAEGSAPGCAGPSTVPGERTFELTEILNGFDPVPAAPPWGCSTWGVCSVDCHISCFYNEDCPRDGGTIQVCLCSGQCP